MSTDEGDLRTFLARCSPTDRLVLLLRFADQLNPAEIARCLGLDAGFVARRLRVLERRAVRRATVQA